MKEFDVENDPCCYTCLNGEYVKDNDTGYHVLCHKTDSYKEPEEICGDFKG